MATNNTILPANQAPGAPAPGPMAPPPPPASAQYGPNNWPAPATLTNLTVQERERFRKKMEIADLIHEIHVGLPGYKGPNDFQSSRWDLILTEYQRLKSLRGLDWMSSPTNGKSLNSSFQTIKKILRDLINLNAARPGPLPRKQLPSGRTKSHGGQRQTGTKKAIADLSGVQNRDIKAEWGQVEEFEEDNYDFEEGEEEQGGEEGDTEMTDEEVASDDEAELKTLASGRFT